MTRLKNAFINLCDEDAAATTEDAELLFKLITIIIAILILVINSWA